jgi:sigma-E factor negative regulatory protein RseA
MMTNVEDLKNRAQVSDLMDGRLRGGAFAQAVDLVNANSEARAAWHANHVIGDVLRFGNAAGDAADAQFVDRFRTRLAQADAKPGEPSGTMARQPKKLSGSTATVDFGLDRHRPDSANDSNFRWKILAGAASLAAVAAIGWGVWLNGGSAVGAGGQLAQTGAAAVSVAASGGAAVSAAGTEPQVMIRDPHLDALLAAHKQFGGTSALQMPAGFLRNATFESSSR